MVPQEPQEPQEAPRSTHPPRSNAFEQERQCDGPIEGASPNSAAKHRQPQSGDEGGDLGEYERRVPGSDTWGAVLCVQSYINNRYLDMRLKTWSHGSRHM